MKQYFGLSTIMLCLAISSGVMAQHKDERETFNLAAASQAGASPLYFNPADPAVPLITPGSFSNDKECAVRNGLPHFFKKAASGEPLTIAFIGGSNTQGMQCYRPQTARYIQSMFPAVAMKAINAGVSGTGTDLGACRLHDQLLKYNPDLVFVEFAVNGAYRDGMEGIIRQIRKYNPDIDICLIYTLHNDQARQYVAGIIPENIVGLEEVAAHYNIPGIHLGMEAAKLQDEGKLVWKGDTNTVKDKIVFSNDGLHPVLAGGNLYAAAIARSLNKMKNARVAPSTPLPTPLIADNWEDAGMYAPQDVATFSSGWSKINPNDSKLKQFRTWFPYIMKADKPGEYFTCKFKGSMFGFFDVGGPEVGQVEVMVDGKKVNLADRGIVGTRILKTLDSTDNNGNALLNRFNGYCNNRYRGQYELITLEPGIHTVTIRLSAEKSDKAKILGDKQQEDITKNPAKYDNRVVYLGKILLRGTPL